MSDDRYWLEKFKINSILSGHLDINWSNEELGFGGLFLYDEDGKLFISNEYMSKDSVRAILYKVADYIVDNAEFLDVPGESENDSE